MRGERYHYPRCRIVGSLEWRFEMRCFAGRQTCYRRIYDLELNLLFRGVSQRNP
jgi:hypothetical protein